jgi:hypothetical protein
MGKFAWFILGLVLGAAIALAAVTLTGRHRGEATPSDEAPPVITTLPQSPVPGGDDSLSPAPTPPPVRKPEMAPAPTSPEDEAQMAEDAAAAGMTSRSRPRAEPQPAPEAAPASDQQ